MLVLFATFGLQEGPDPLTLPIGPGRHDLVALKVGGPYDMRAGKPVTVAQIAQAADGVRFVFVGESHDNAVHHKLQADIIRALADRGRNVIVGMEMFPRAAQPALNLWTLGKLTEDQFIERAEWKKNWGMDFALYRPIFDVVREKRLPLVGLNVPRDLVRKVGHGGASALTPEDRGDMPDLDLSNKEHRRLFDAMVGGGAHGVGDNMYAAQVLWDTAMAHAALAYLRRMALSDNTVFVVVAGSGHVMYDLAIPLRVEQQAPGTKMLTVCGFEGTPDKGVSVTRGIADYALVTAKAP
jgi:uncharacterized iron-regulated protein